MTTDLVVIGAGGFGRETLDVIEAINRAPGSPALNVLGVVDDNPSAQNLERLRARGVAHLGSIEAVLEAAPCAHFIVAIGDPTTKERVATTFRARGWTAVSAIHPDATVGSQARIGEGVIVCGGVQVSTKVTLGTHVHVNPNATVGHDTAVGDFASINPGAVISGEVVIEAQTLIGAGAVVLQGLVIGAGAVVGASACVTKDVAAGSVVVGVPARAIDGSTQ